MSTPAERTIACAQRGLLTKLLEASGPLSDASSGVSPKMRTNPPNGIQLIE